jgi:hypothetical protein
VAFLLLLFPSLHFVDLFSVIRINSHSSAYIYYVTFCGDVRALLKKQTLIESNQLLVDID